jgi:hypothetical protein
VTYAQITLQLIFHVLYSNRQKRCSLRAVQNIAIVVRLNKTGGKSMNVGRQAIDIKPDDPNLLRLADSLFSGRAPRLTGVTIYNMDQSFIHNA